MQHKSTISFFELDRDYIYDKYKYTEGDSKSHSYMKIFSL